MIFALNKRFLSAIAFLIALVSTAIQAYNINLGVKWSSAQTSLYVDLPDANNRWNTAFAEAAQQWKSATSFQFSIISQFRDPCLRNDRLSGVNWLATDCGDDFGEALAVTHTSWNTRTLQFVQADMVFNNTLEWSVYNSKLQTASTGDLLYDFRRVALHELGHVIGLGHVAQTTDSIMTPIISDLDTVTADDTQGVQALYGITSSNQAPQAHFTLTPASGVAPLTIHLDASASQDSDGVIVNYNWTSSNGLSSNGKTTSFTFNQPGNYTITLKVTDDQGATNSSEQSLTINAATLPANYVASNGLLTVQDVSAFGQHYFVELQNQGNFTFTLINSTLTNTRNAIDTATYEDNTGLLKIPVVTVDTLNYTATLKNIGNYLFILQSYSEIK